ncbi:MAG: class I SAM-dependent methyltransferase [Actinomycetota bacterium]
MHVSDPNRLARALFSGLPRRYDLLAEVLSLGQNRRWRREAVEHVGVSEPARVLDVGTRIMSLGGGLVMWGVKANG